MTCTCEHPTPASQAKAMLAMRVAAITEPLDAPYPTPSYPPRDWFDRPSWLQPNQGLTVHDDGQVGGYFYQAGACLVHMHAACPGPSPTHYAAFHQQDVVLADGETLRVGVIGNTNGHADPFGTIGSAQRHYADPDAQMIVCRAGDDEHGGWIAGALVPGLTYGDAALVRRCALSGDWRPMPPSWWKMHNVSAGVARAVDGYDCIGPTFVNRPGLPLVQAFARSASAKPVLLGGMGGVQLDEEVFTVARGATMEVTLPDGTHIKHTDPMQAAGAVPVDEEAPVDGPVDAMAEYDQRLAGLESAVGEIMQWIQEQTAQQKAAMEAALLPLPEVTVDA